MQLILPLSRDARLLDLQRVILLNISTHWIYIYIKQKHSLYFKDLISKRRKLDRKWNRFSWNRECSQFLSMLPKVYCLGVKFKKKEIGPIVEHSIYALIPYTIISLFFFLALRSLGTLIYSDRSLVKGLNEVENLKPPRTSEKIYYRNFFACFFNFSLNLWILQSGISTFDVGRLKDHESSRVITRGKEILS